MCETAMIQQQKSEAKHFFAAVGKMIEKNTNGNLNVFFSNSNNNETKHNTIINQRKSNTCLIHPNYAILH